MTELCKIFEKATRNMQARQRAYERIERTKRYLKKLHKKHWKDLFIQPLAEALKPHFPDRECEILGPCGLGSQVTIIFKEKGSEDFKGSKSLTLTPVDLNNGVFAWIDEHSPSSYEKGTIGALNNLGHRTHKTPTNATIEHIATLFQ
jgi:hypothetical protein